MRASRALLVGLLVAVAACRSASEECLEQPAEEPSVGQIEVSPIQASLESRVLALEVASLELCLGIEADWMNHDLEGGCAFYFDPNDRPVPVDIASVPVDRARIDRLERAVEAVRASLGRDERVAFERDVGGTFASVKAQFELNK